MFSLISGFWQLWFTKPTVQILLIGLDYAGKTTLLEQCKHIFSLKKNQSSNHGLFNSLKKNSNQGNSISNNAISSSHFIPNTLPTIGMNLAKLVFPSYEVIMWDLGGQLKMRSMWERYYDEASAIIFLIDSSDINRIEEAKLAFESVCEHSLQNHTPVFLLANKQDISGALTASQISMAFYSSVQDASEKLRVFPISAKTGEGIEVAIKFVIEEARRNQERLDSIDPR